MKFKSFQDYLKTGVCPQKIKEIEVQMELEYRALKSFQNGLAQALNNYMQQQKLGFNELVIKLDISPEKLSKILKGECNLSLENIVRIAALIKRKPSFSLDFDKDFLNL
jgi:transcriptional regulator with XRE-family HTH domain